MGRDRRLTISRSERFLGSYSYGNVDGGGNGGAETEFVEEDVWSTIDYDITDRPSGDWMPRTAAESVFVRNGSHVGGLSMAFHDTSCTSSRIVHQIRPGNDLSPSPRGMARSAPMNVPDWSKILRVDSVDSLHSYDSDRVDDHDDIGGDTVVPPHEWVARGRYAGGGPSVFEGVGRTLKGRDLRRVRDAVWSQTGFAG